MGSRPARDMAHIITMRRPLGDALGRISRRWCTGSKPVRHEAATVGSSYRTPDAQAEAAGFLADRAYLPAARADEVLATHRRGAR